MLVERQVVIPEKSVAIEPVTIFGEMALFPASGRRTASAECARDARLLVMTYEQFEQLYFQNPEFSLYLLRLIVRPTDATHGLEPAAPAADLSRCGRPQYLHLHCEIRAGCRSGGRVGPPTIAPTMARRRSRWDGP